MCPALGAGGQTGQLLADAGRFQYEAVSSQSIGTCLENHRPGKSSNAGVLRGQRPLSLTEGPPEESLVRLSGCSGSRILVLDPPLLH